MKLGFPPRSILALDAEGAMHPFRCGLRLDGGLSVRPGEVRKGNGSYILALDSTLLFRRRARVLPGSRRELHLIAANLFPFSPEATTYAAATAANGDAYFYALQHAKLDALIEDLGPPQAVLASPPAARSLARALSERLARGAIADLLPEPRRLLPPGGLVTVVLVAALAAALWTAGGMWTERQAAREASLDNELARLERVAEPLIARRRAIVRMEAALGALGEFSAAPGGVALMRLSEVFRALPPDAVLDRVTYRDGILTVEGLGNDPLGWLGPLGVEEGDVDIAARPVTDRFTARIATAPQGGVDTAGERGNSDGGSRARHE